MMILVENMSDISKGAWRGGLVAEMTHDELLTAFGELAEQYQAVVERLRTIETPEYLANKFVHDA